jgi:bacterioferritin
MKEKKKLVAILNSILIEKLTSINQFMAHSEMCENLGYSRLHKAIQKMAMDQMLLAEWLIERISTLDGSNTLSKLNSLMIGKTVSELMSNNNKPDAFRAHNDAIKLALEDDDETTADLLKKILNLEAGPTDWAELQREQIEKKGLENYLITQAESMVN